MKDEIFFENINIDISSETIKLSYITYDKTPTINPPKSGFILTRSPEQSIQDFRTESFKLLTEHLLKISDNTFKEYLKTLT